MKRFSIILLGALAILMAGCSKDIAPSSSNPDAWKTDITLPVPVEFGKPSLATKADYISDISGATLNFGVFGYSTATTDVSVDDDNRLIYNKFAKYTAADGFKLNETVYYPMTNNWNYNFYAYYKAKSSSDEANPNPYIKDNKVYVNFNVGREDILYGNTKVTPAMETTVGRSGFNGGYIRAVRTLEEQDKTAVQYADYNPSIAFKHVTAALQFYVKASSEAAEQVFKDKSIYVKRIALTDLPVAADLCVVDIDGDDYGDEIITNPNEGVLTGTQNGTQYVWDYNANGTYASAWQHYPVHTDQFSLDNAVGDPVFIVPTEGALNGYLELSETSLDPIEFTLDPSAMNLATTGRFQAGYRYNITLIVHSPEEVTFNVSVEAWKDGITGEDATTNPDDYEYELGE